MDPIKLKMLSNDSKILYALKESGGESGGLAFSELKQITNLSPNTVNNHLKNLQNKKLIEKTLISGKKRENTIGYRITTEGIQKIDTELTLTPEQDWLIKIPRRIDTLDRLLNQQELSAPTYNKNKTYLAQIEDTYFNLLSEVLHILGFGQQLGRINSIVAQIGSYCSKFGEDFFKLTPNLYLYLAVIYIFFNSLENPQFHLSDSQFIDSYGRADEEFGRKVEKRTDLQSVLIKKVSDAGLINELDMVLAKQAQNKITHVYLEENYLASAYSTVEHDILKQNADLSNTIKRYRDAFFDYYSSKHASLEKFNAALQSILDGNYGIQYFMLNNEHYFFHERSTVGSFLNGRINDALTEQYINKKLLAPNLATETVIEIANDITNDMEAMHIIWEDIKSKFYDVVLQNLYKRSSIMGLRKSVEKEGTFRLEEVRGFCPNCGNRVLFDSDECDYCRTSFKNIELVYDVKKAKEISETIKKTKQIGTNTMEDSSMFTKCTRCKSDVARSWTICPKCKHKLK